MSPRCAYVEAVDGVFDNVVSLRRKVDRDWPLEDEPAELALDFAGMELDRVLLLDTYAEVGLLPELTEEEDDDLLLEPKDDDEEDLPLEPKDEDEEDLLLEPKDDDEEDLLLEPKDDEDLFEELYGPAQAL